MNRRGFLRGISALFVAAPSVFRASSLMAISPETLEGFRFSGFFSIIPLDQISAIDFAMWQRFHEAEHSAIFEISEKISSSGLGHLTL